jgi:hypothetical protein
VITIIGLSIKVFIIHLLKRRIRAIKVRYNDDFPALGIS